MAPRAGAWLGGILFAAGVFAFFGGALFPGFSALAYAGLGAVLLSVVLVGRALRQVSRQIGDNHARFEAMLRVEAERDKKKPGA
jgi:hypothetical protein